MGWWFNLPVCAQVLIGFCIGAAFTSIVVGFLELRSDKDEL